MRALLSAMLGASFMLGLAFGPAAADCVTPAQVIERIKADAPDAKATQYDGAEAAVLAEHIGNLVSARIAPGATFLVAIEPGSPFAHIVMFRDGCATNHGRFMADMVRAWFLGTPG